MSHISPSGSDRAKTFQRVSQAADTVRPQPLLTFAVDGAYVRVQAAGKPPQETPPHKRGEITGFSGSARRRLIDLCSQVKQASRADLPLFVTLTYPAAWPADPARWKRDLDAFGKRLARKVVETSVIWKLEFQARGAPHFHLLVFGCRWLDPHWLSRVWYEIVDSGDARHQRAGTRVEFIRSWKGVMYYASKYLAKKTIENIPGMVGRYWGVLGRQYLPVELIVLPLTFGQFFRLRRVLVAHAAAARRAAGRGYVPTIHGEHHGLKRYLLYSAVLDLLRSL